MYYIGIDIGGTGIKAGVVSEKGEIIVKNAIETNVAGGFEIIVKEIAELVNGVIKEAGITLDEVESVGIGCPGSIDDRTGVVIYSNNLKFENVPLSDELKKYIDKPIYINNDANCAALGEFFALNDETVEDFVAITLGTGVGGGVIINKKLYTGFNGVGAELGHSVIVVDGNPCSCGRKGCWEAYASATALIKATAEAGEKNPDSLVAKMIEEAGKVSGRTAWEAMRMGDKTGKEVVDSYVKYVSEGIINIVNIFQPSVIAIGGGISKEGDNLLIPVNEYIKDKCYAAGLVAPVKIVTAQLGNDAGIIGAAFLGK